ncbi:MAG: hypothetical protein E7812_03580 [Phenylobacterium sp.]|nr:MAG: hypothetical protein E7812_03580 [Phenylobacterium sp.]
MSLKLLLLALTAAAAATAAQAGETACWFEKGVVVVPAEVAGVAGDYILDSAEPQTVLAETQAQGAGFEATALTADVALAGAVQPNVAIAVKDLDVRTGLFPTPIAGVIGADVLKAWVADLSFTPCRLRLSAPGAAPAFGRAVSLPLRMTAGVPTLEAKASDGARSLTASFALSTGADAPVRLSDTAASVRGAAKPKELYPNGVLRAKLAGLTFAGRRFEDVLAGLETSSDPTVAGLLGAPLFHDLRVRLDIPGGQLLIAPNEKGPGSRRGP